MTSQYIHGSTPDEQRRLSLLNTLINDASLRALDLRGGERVLDVGSGLGQLSRAMARRKASVVGVERDAEQRADGSHPSTVVFTFEARPEDRTYVHVVNSGFKGDADEVLAKALDSTGGFSLVLAAAKAWLEHGVELHVVADKL